MKYLGLFMLALVLPACLLSAAGALAPAFGQAQPIRDQPVPAGHQIQLAKVQQEQLRFGHLTIEDGLSQNAIHTILQDRRGFLWIGTKDGLNRYDGYTFTVFRHNPFDSTTLSDNHITALYEDSQGTLWVGTAGGGVDRMDKETETFRRYPNGPAHDLLDIAEDHDGHLWIGTRGGGLFRLAPDGSDEAFFTRFLNDPTDARSLGGNDVKAVLVDQQGMIWVGTEKGLSRLDPRDTDAGFTHYPHEPDRRAGQIDRSVTALYEETDGTLWIGTFLGVSRFDRQTERFTHYYHKFNEFRYGWGVVWHIVQDPAGYFWLATPAALMQFEPATTHYTYFQHDPLAPESLSDNFIRALFQDQSGILWIGTNGYGLDSHNPRANRFQTFRRPVNPASRLTGFSIRMLFEDADENVWISAGVLYKWDRKMGTFTSFETRSDHPEAFGNTGVWSMVQDRQGRLWVASYEGIYRYDLDTQTYQRFFHDPQDPGGLPEKIVFDVFEDRDGGIWAVTENYVSRLTDAALGRFQSYQYTEQTSIGEFTFPATYQDAQGYLWLASQQGLVRFDPVNGSFRHYRHDPGQPSSLSNDIVLSICPDPEEPDRYLWLGTSGGGLNRMDLDAETFQHFTEADGLPNNVVYGVLADEAGHLWMSTNKGLARFDPQTSTFTNYDVHDGLQSNEFNAGAYFKSNRGELFFGGIYGFNHFYPDAITPNPHVPEIVITDFKRAGQSESLRDANTVLDRAITETDALRLAHRDNIISFDFAALEYSAPEKNRYAYMLEGFNDEWIASDAARTATYTNLPPGAYTFRVKGSNNDGVWNEEGTALGLVIAPPWWRTWWAYALYALTALGLLYSLRGYEMNRLRLKSRLEMEHLEAEKLRELDRARSRFFANVSHEFRTPLTLTVGPLDDVLQGLHGSVSAEAREQVMLARRNAERVLDLVRQILDVARLEAGRMKLEARRVDLGAFLRAQAQPFQALAERKLITFQVEESPAPVLVYLDTGHMEKVVGNLLSNAFKFTPESGAIHVRLDEVDATVRVLVRDSGPGIPADDLPHVFERFYQVNESTTRLQPGTGIGLALAKELVELHGGTIGVESDEGFGSTFIVTLCRGQAHLQPDQIIATPETAVMRPRILSDDSEALLETSSGDGLTWERGEGKEGEDVTTVLIVEDHAEVRAYVHKHLAPHYRVVEASDGVDGLEKARRLLPDLIVSDVMMPEMDGYALCQMLKSDPETNGIPVILLTARAAPEDKLEGLQGKADDFITKPFEVQELLARIDNLIGSRKHLRERFRQEGMALVLGMDETAPVLQPRTVNVTSPETAFLEQVQDAIEAHLSDELFTVERLAEAVGVSRGHLHRQLKELVDQTPSEAIRTMRLERAGQLLKAGAGTVSEIAYAVGFKSLAHFSNAFLDYYGCRPSAYPSAHRAAL